MTNVENAKFVGAGRCGLPMRVGSFRKVPADTIIASMESAGLIRREPNPKFSQRRRWRAVPGWRAKVEALRGEAAARASRWGPPQ